MKKISLALGTVALLSLTTLSAPALAQPYSGHVIVVPKRHVADFFEMTDAEQAAVLELLREVRRSIGSRHSPDGYNIGVNVGEAAGQSRMHVHVHLIPRYRGDVPDPKGGVRCVLASKPRP